MAGIFDRFTEKLRANDYDEEDDYLDDEEEAEEEKDERDNSSRFSRFFNRAVGKNNDENEEEDEEDNQPPVRRVPGSVTPIRRANPMELHVVRPNSMEDARELSDTLREGKVVAINLEGIQIDIAQRIIDFASGACYSLDGNLQKISSYIFILTPRDVELVGDFASQLGAKSSSPFRQ